MSFGAVLDDRGAPLSELIQLGDYLTRRPLGPGSEVMSAACRGK